MSEEKYYCPDRDKYVVIMRSGSRVHSLRDAAGSVRWFPTKQSAHYARHWWMVAYGQSLLQNPASEDFEDTYPTLVVESAMMDRACLIHTASGYGFPAHVPPTPKRYREEFIINPRNCSPWTAMLDSDTEIDIERAAEYFRKEDGLDYDRDGITMTSTSVQFSVDLDKWEAEHADDEDDDEAN